MAWPICDDAAPSARDPPLGRGKHVSQRAQLGTIGRRHAQPMPLDQADGRRLDPRRTIGPADRPGMALAARRGEAAAPSVAGQTNALEHRIDPVAGTLRVTQPLEDRDADTLAGNHAVRIGRERTRRCPSATADQAGERRAGNRRRPRCRHLPPAPDRLAARSGPDSPAPGRPAPMRWRRPRRSWPRSDRAGEPAVLPWRW